MATIVIVLAIGLFFGGMVLMLATGYQDTEQKREMQAKARQAEALQRAEALQQATAAGAALSFFASPRAAQPAGKIAFNDSLVSRLEHDIRQEQAIVAQFVHRPSLDTLYQHPTSPNYVQ